MVIVGSKLFSFDICIFPDYSRPSSAASGGWRGQEASETEEELKRRQKRQLDMFYKSIDQTKETQREYLDETQNESLDPPQNM